MKQKRNLALSLLLLVTAAACSKSDSESSSPGSSSTIDSTSIVSGTAEGSTETGADDDDLIENSSFTSTVTINFGSTIAITNPLASAGVAITQSGSLVTITSTAKAVEYILTGTTTNGGVKIYSDNKFKLTLNGATITNSTGPAINIQSKKRAFLVLADNTTNTLTDGSTYATSTEDQKGTIFSEGQLIFSGTGTLNVKGNYKHGIVSDDYIRIRSGNITITGTATDGIHTNDAVIVDGGTINITSSSDGIEADEGHIIINAGTINITAADDGIAASYEEGDTSIDPYIVINGGTINITTTEGEGIESKSTLTINNGYIVTKTADDGLNAGTAININGGYVYSYSTGNDAMDSNGTFTITGGKVIAIGSRAPEAGFDCDARTFKITGGIVVGTGGATSSPTASVSPVRSVIMGSGNANQLIHIEAADGTEALTFLSPTSYSTLLFASSKLKANTTYNVYTGGSVTDGISFQGLYTSGTYTPGTKGSSFTTSSVVTQTGGSISRN